MFARQQKLNVTSDELTIIEAALETQAKILNVQASAGGTAALYRLNKVKRVLTRMAQQKVVKTPTVRRRTFCWLRLARCPG